ncbi:hypothetical protein BpHYR1_000222 [Brachionus plicatilis]|uniref:Uncharacterized protein n=1 Tax=Brachionus plicatilis TaxID=10195 RepID=A0A3M7R4G1_BRAPC|nr:hypothetical protein BpHYR1_000222 [Brachionus plicatilis]
MNSKSSLSICLDSESSPYSFTSLTTNAIKLFSSNISLTEFKKSNQDLLIHYVGQISFNIEIKKGCIVELDLSMKNILFSKLFKQSSNQK